MPPGASHRVADVSNFFLLKNCSQQYGSECGKRGEFCPYIATIPPKKLWLGLKQEVMKFNQLASLSMLSHFYFSNIFLVYFTRKGTLDSNQGLMDERPVLSPLSQWGSGSSEHQTGVLHRETMANLRIEDIRRKPRNSCKTRYTFS